MKTHLGGLPTWRTAIPYPAHRSARTIGAFPCRRVADASWGKDPRFQSRIERVIVLTVASPPTGSATVRTSLSDGGWYIVSRILRLSAIALVVCAAGRRIASAAVNTEPEPTADGWSLMTSPFGPGFWLTDPSNAEVAHAFVPPGARASHDESDQERRGWRHLTIDDDLGVRPTVTRLDTHEVFRMVPRSRRGWVMEQSIRHSDGSVRGADLLETLAAMGVEPELLDRALRALGQRENLRPYRAAVRATHVALDATQAAVEKSQGAVIAAEGLAFGAQRGDERAGRREESLLPPWRLRAGMRSQARSCGPTLPPDVPHTVNATAEPS